MSFVPDYLFKDVCTANSLGRQREGFPLRPGQVCLLPSIIKMMVASGAKFEQCLLAAPFKD